MSFTGQSAVVTGGGSGMGEAVAKRLARVGVSVLIADYNETSGVRVADEITAAGGTAIFHRTDVSDADSTQAMVDAAVAAFGQLDLAANIAGIAQTPAPVQDTDPETWQRVLAVNSTGIFNSLRAEIPAMLSAGGGAIVNIISTIGLIPSPGMNAYAASKHAAVGLTKTAALDNARTGIRINGIAPGIIHTPLLSSSADDATIDAYADIVPIGRLGTADEIANVAVFLLSEQASYMTGAIVPVDGGQLLG